MYSYWLFQLALDSNKSNLHTNTHPIPSVFYRKDSVFFEDRTNMWEGLGRVHSDLDATRRLEELKSEFAESIRISN